VCFACAFDTYPWAVLYIVSIGQRNCLRFISWSFCDDFLFLASRARSTVYICTPVHFLFPLCSLELCNHQDLLTLFYFFTGSCWVWVWRENWSTCFAKRWLLKVYNVASLVHVLKKFTWSHACLWFVHAQ